MVLDVAAIVVFTASGTSAKRIAKFRPACPVYAATFDDRTRDSLAIHWGVTSVVVEKFDEVDKETKLARDIALSHGCKKGDEIIIVTGYPFGSNATNSMRIIEV
ncbi:pyruvate kinase alpha/beta domain-containing protein [Breznakia pachnodae]|uniref:Pyruvate kinase n=1 Tax=Breznakia pachnodae TaxID=265178 RepID=A0ABU0E3I5_9FIRM|nr:pyruvate kinase [Breznakia pachnodae]